MFRAAKSILMVNVRRNIQPAIATSWLHTQALQPRPAGRLGWRRVMPLMPGVEATFSRAAASRLQSSSSGHGTHDEWGDHEKRLTAAPQLGNDG